MNTRRKAWIGAALGSTAAALAFGISTLQYPKKSVRSKPGDIEAKASLEKEMEALLNKQLLIQQKVTGNETPDFPILYPFPNHSLKITDMKENYPFRKIVRKDETAFVFSGIPPGNVDAVLFSSEANTEYNYAFTYPAGFIERERQGQYVDLSAFITVQLKSIRHSDRKPSESPLEAASIRLHPDAWQGELGIWNNIFRSISIKDGIIIRERPSAELRQLGATTPYVAANYNSAKNHIVPDAEFAQLQETFDRRVAQAGPAAREAAGILQGSLGKSGLYLTDARISVPPYIEEFMDDAGTIGFAQSGDDSQPVDRLYFSTSKGAPVRIEAEITAPQGTVQKILRSGHFELPGKNVLLSARGIALPKDQERTLENAAITFLSKVLRPLPVLQASASIGPSFLPPAR